MTQAQGHTFTKQIGQTVYVARYHFNLMADLNWHMSGIDNFQFVMPWFGKRFENVLLT